MKGDEAGLHEEVKEVNKYASLRNGSTYFGDVTLLRHAILPLTRRDDFPRPFSRKRRRFADIQRDTLSLTLFRCLPGFFSDP